MLPLDLKIDPRNVRLASALERLETYDFSSISRDAVHKFGWSMDKAQTVELQAKQFFALAYLDPGHYHIPECDVDEYWHRMILHTRWYHDFFDIVFGCYYHHTPAPDPEHMSEANRERTKTVFDYWFGQKLERLVITCTQCKSPAIIAKGLEPSPEAMPDL